METSDWIAAAAVSVAIAALGLGEYRAVKARRARTERNIVDWQIDWIRRDTFQLTNHGPDEARDVLVKLTSEYKTVEATTRRMTKSGRIEIAVPHLAHIWDESIAREVEPESFRIVSRVQYGGRITWRSPRGMQQNLILESAVDAPAKEHVPKNEI